MCIGIFSMLSTSFYKKRENEQIVLIILNLQIDNLLKLRCDWNDKEEKNWRHDQEKVVVDLLFTDS